MTDTPDEKQNTGAANSTTGDLNSNEQGKAENIKNDDSSNGAKPAEKPLEEQLTDVQTKAAEYLEGWQRARAEFANYKKRADKEREEAYTIAAAETLGKLLPIIDDFDLAVANVPAEKANDDVIKGFGLIHRKFLNLLDNVGIKVINPVGEAFNPTFHEAIGQDENPNVPSGHVTTVLRKGYMHGDRVLRPALVRVSS